MAQIQIRKATRQKAKMRLGLSAVSGAGKTYSALLMAKGLCGEWSKIGIIDTENRSADLYVHLCGSDEPYNTITLEDFSPESYIEAIKTFEDYGCEVIIIDSIAHEWSFCTELHTKLGGRYQDFAKITPRHDAFIQKMLQSKCHIITTVRRKQDYAMIVENNKHKVEKAGLKEQTRDGWDYELTVNLALDMNHFVTVEKDRTGLFVDKPTFIITEETGKLIKDWCEMGVEAEVKKPAFNFNLMTEGFLGKLQKQFETNKDFDTHAFLSKHYTISNNDSEIVYNSLIDWIHKKKLHEKTQ